MSDLVIAPFDWRAHLPVHPAADLFPLLSESELKELADDIQKNGLQCSIVLWRKFDGGDRKDCLIDGRNRLDALALLGWLGPKRERRDRERAADYAAVNPLTIRYPPEAEIIPADDGAGDSGGFELHSGLYDDDDVYRAVLALNVHRRHLTAEQKRDLIAELLKADPSKSDRQIAEQTKSSPTTVGKVRAEKEATGDVSKVDTRTDTKGRKQPAKKIKVNGHAIEADDLSPVAQEQIAKALERTPEETRTELERLHALTSSMATEIAHIDDPDTTFDSAWHEATTEIEKLDTENGELRAEIERLKVAQSTPAASYLEKPWLRLATDEARQPETFNPDAPLDDLEKQLQGIVAELDIRERAAAELIRCLVDHRKQGIRSIAKKLAKDPKWVKERFERAKPVLEAAE
jgi:hypothetical protein